MEIIQSNVINPASTLEDVALTATLPSEMVGAQVELIGWCAAKIAVIATECDELRGAHERAVKMKWKAQPLYALHQRALKRLSYYEKVKAALEAGYFIVPNFPIQMFAIKTKKAKPKYELKIGRWTEHTQEAQELPEGTGEYRNPFPLIKSKTVVTPEGEKPANWASAWDEMEFPLTMAKPIIMDATDRAMALKIFDQIGIMPATRNEDPVIIGQVFRKIGYQTKIVSFMIAWHLDTSMI